MAHYHSIEIKKIDWNIFDLREKIENQFYTKVSANPDKYCINNNLPNDDVMYYHEYKMVVLENGKFIELDFVFFILFDPGRIEIIDNNGTMFAKFEMLDLNTSQNFDLDKILHIPRVTCHPKSKAILNENGKLFHYEHIDSNRKLIPFNGFYDGNLPKFNSRLKQHEYFGFYYSCDLPEFNTISFLLERNPETEFECDFIDDPKLNGYGGYWYHERINFLQFY